MCDFFPVSEQSILDWDGENTDFLLKLDSHGIFPTPEEDADAFRARVLKEFKYMESICASQNSDGKILLYSDPANKDELKIDKKDRIDPKLAEPAWEITQKLYGFAANHIPGFYLFENVGFLWGGCSLYDDETQMKVFLLRPAFRNKDRFLIYNRTELIAHELCHSARQVLNDHAIEEYFAYQTAKSRIRRYLGNCFIKEFDAILFLLPALLLLVGQIIKSFLFSSLPIFPFWIFLICVLAYFLIRNQRSRSAISRARKILTSFSSNPDAILFRSTLAEIKLISSSFDEYFSSLSPLRKKVISSFLHKNSPTV